MTARSKFSLFLLALIVGLVLVPLAAAHAEMRPEKAKAGVNKRFVLNVENESADTPYVKLVVRFPESVVTATFVQVPGWTRTVTTKPLDTPVTGPDGETITERIDTVTWEGGSISPGEEGEFPFRFLVPEQPGTTIFFPTLQTYADGETVRWIGAPGSEDPAPGVLITQGAGGGGGTTTEPEPVTTTVQTTVTTEAESTTEADTTETIAPVPASGEDDGSSWPLYLGLLALLAAIAGLAYWLYLRNQDDEPPVGDGGVPATGPPPVDPAGPRGSSSMPGGGQAPEPPGETEVIDPGSQPTQRIDPAGAQETQRIDPDDRQQG